MSGGDTDHRTTNASPFVQLENESEHVQRDDDAVTMGKRAGRRDSSRSGIISSFSLESARQSNFCGSSLKHRPATISFQSPAGAALFHLRQRRLARVVDLEHIGEADIEEPPHHSIGPAQTSLPLAA